MIQLTAHDIVPERPFTHPNQMVKDLITLRYMASEVGRLLETPTVYAQRHQPLTIHHPKPDEWIHRQIISQPERLLTAPHLTIVGFLSFKQHNADVSLAQAYDKLLVAEIPQYPDLLSYSSIAHSSGDFSNLVIFANARGKSHWSQSRAHAEAVQNLAPNYYASVRLYNGVLPEGIMASELLYLTAVKYFDYQCNPFWDAVRLLN